MQHNSASSASPGGCAPLALTTAIVAFVIVCPLAGALASAFDGTDRGRTLVASVLGLVLAAVFWLLARGARLPHRRAIYGAWARAALFPVLMLPLAFIPPADAQRAALAQLGLVALYAVVIARNRESKPRRERNQASRNRLLLCSSALAAVLAYPWLRWGALGSPLDVAVALATGLLFGWSACALLARIEDGATHGDAGVPHGLGAAGLVAAIALLLLASGLGFNGAPLLATIMLPPLGWLAVALGRLEAGGPTTRAGSQAAVALLLGLAASLPLLFGDTDTLPLIHLFGEPETIAYGLRAALISGGLALALALLVARRGAWLFGRRGAAAGVAALWLLGALIYLMAGKPGLYGDRLFVVLRDQADVAALAAVGDYDARRRAVYTQLTSHAEERQAALRERLDALGVAYTPYYLVNALEVEGGEPLRLWLEQRPEVAAVLPSPFLRPLPEAPGLARGDASPPEAPPWNLEVIGAPRVWRELGVRGAGIVVGQSDSGAEWRHPELRDAYRGRGAGGRADHDYHWLDPWNGSAEPVDIGGHGTHTLGIAVGRSVGVAPEARWIGCVNLGRNVGNAARYLDCMQFMLAPYPQGGDPFRDGDPLRSAHVLNNSWGCPEETEGCAPDTLLPAVRALRAAGLFVVSSAGNEGPECSSVDDPLGIYDEVVSVGATDQSGALTSFSSVGPVDADGSGRLKPDLVAPGADILSSFPGDTYYRGDGTSQAGPHVAGVVALLWSASPALIGDIERTEAVLRESAAPVTGRPADTGAAGDACGVSLATTPNNLVGYGLLDAYAAVRRAQNLPLASRP